MEASPTGLTIVHVADIWVWVISNRVFDVYKYLGNPAACVYVWGGGEEIVPIKSLSIPV